MEFMWGNRLNISFSKEEIVELLSEDDLRSSAGFGLYQFLSIYSRKSEDVFLNKINDSFGEDCVLAYGDWSRNTLMKYFMPTKNVGMED